MVPDPFIVEASARHEQSMIVLHGRGDTAANFGRDFLTTRLPYGSSMEDSLPNTKFIFPYGTMRMPVLSPMYQWYHLTTLKDPSKDQENAKRGLLESSEMIHDLIKAEAEIVGINNVVLGGLSQGFATMLIALCLWTGPPIKAAFGMSGWFPLHKLISESLKEREDTVGQDSTSQSLEVQSAKGSVQAIEALRKFMSADTGEPIPMFHVPMFIGHGDKDNIVRVELGKEAAECWKKLGCQTEWHEYPGLIHWYNGEELFDILKFIPK